MTWLPLLHWESPVWKTSVEPSPEYISVISSDRPDDSISTVFHSANFLVTDKDSKPYLNNDGLGAISKST